MKSPRVWLARFLAITLLAASARAQTYTPYAADAYTLHLWHLDESTVPAADAGSASLPLATLGGGATLGNASIGGMGTALSTVDGGANVPTGTGTDAYLAPTTLVDGAGDNVTTPLADPATGAFTFEALVRFSFNPTATFSRRNAPMQILSGEQDDTGGGVRVFQFRFDPAGYNPNADGVTTALTVPALEFINIASGDDKIVLLPTTGTNAVAQGVWYHVAVTYTGAAGTAGNLTYYWTRLDGTQTQAAVLGTKTLASNLAVGAVDFALGNTGRGVSQNNFVGFIDEVRISSNARAPKEMVPASLGGGPYLPSAPVGLSAATSTNGINLSWSAVGNATGYNVKRATVSGGPYTVVASPASASYADNGLTGSTRYYYVVSAANSVGESANSVEQSATTYNALDTDNNGLPDAWEMKYFGHIGVDPNADPDGDWFTNLQEYLAGSDPTASGSTPAGAKTRLIPVYDGNAAATSGYAYAGTSAINTVSFICNGITTLGNQQFVTFYGRAQTDASYAYNNTLWVARRTVGATLWQVFRTTFTANDITDAHDTIAFGIDGEGYMHLSWGMHNASAYHYAKSTLPVTGTNTIAFGPDLGTMTGNEVSVTYPQFLTLPGGDLLYLYRVGGAGGGSGNGNTYWNRYSLATHAWSNVNVNGAAVVPMIDGISYSYNAYPNMPCMDANGNVSLVWTWRYSPNWQTNENYAFARSTDAAVTWQRSTGVPYTLPLAEKYVSGTTPSTNCVAEQAVPLPQQSSLINQAGMCLDNQGQPVVASWWAPLTSSGNYSRQYMVAFPTTAGSAWATRQVSNRSVDAASFKDTTGDYVRDLGRPVVLCDKQGRILVLYRDNHPPVSVGGSGGGLTVAYSQTSATDPNRLTWTTLELTSDNLGGYEPVVDLARWQATNVLDILYQASPYTAHNGLTYAAPANSASPIGVFEWDEAAYFATPPLHVSLGAQDAQLTWNSIPGYSYRLWYSTDLNTWTALYTSLPTDTTPNRAKAATLAYTHTGGASGGRGFWRLDVKEGSF